jgi:hypothetical protein
MKTRKQESFLRSQRSVRGPAWRSQAAQELSPPLARSMIRIWDRLTIKLVRFYALNATGPAGSARAAKKYPQIAAALMLDGDSDKTKISKLMILADLPPEEIAQKLGVEAAVVDVWEQLFFDVRDLRAATSWLSAYVLEAECKAGNSALAARMKLALGVGRDGVNAILALDEGAPVDEAERLFQRRLALDLKFDEAISMAMDSDQNRMKFAKLYVDLRLSEKRLVLAEKKLAARCAAARDRFELSKMRMEAAQEQAVVKDAARRPPAERRRRTRAEREAKRAPLEEVQQAARLAEEQATATRIAESPLTQLAWGPAKRPPELPPAPLPPVLPPPAPLPPAPLPAAPPPRRRRSGPLGRPRNLTPSSPQKPIRSTSRATPKCLASSS